MRVVEYDVVHISSQVSKGSRYCMFTPLSTHIVGIDRATGHSELVVGACYIELQ